MTTAEKGCALVELGEAAGATNTLRPLTHSSGSSREGLSVSLRGPNRDPEIYSDPSRHDDYAVAITAYRRGCRCESCKRHTRSYQKEWHKVDQSRMSSSPPTRCEVPECRRQARKRAPRGICNEHYYQQLGWSECSQEGCARHAATKEGRWCPSHAVSRECESCGVTVRMSARAKWCSSTCGRGFARLRVGIETSNFALITTEIIDLFSEDEEQLCWHYTNVGSRGYGAMLVSGRHWLMHRVSKSAEMGRWLLPHEVVHHKCATRSCINPGHLQVVEQAHNAAEMMNRRYYEQRIAELESELEAMRRG